LTHQINLYIELLRKSINLIILIILPSINLYVKFFPNYIIAFNLILTICNLFVTILFTTFKKPYFRKF